MMNTATRNGFLAMVLASVIWGSFSMIFSQISQVPPVDIVAHRLLWGMIFMLGWLGIKGELREIPKVMRERRQLILLAISAMLIALNWLVYVYAVSVGMALEAALGYFLFPLVTVALGAIFKGEKLSISQWISVGFATAAVIILTIGLGKLPWLALFLAVTFALYGFVKSFVKADPIVSVAIENLWLFPLAVLWFIFFARLDIGFLHSPISAFWLILVGMLTGLTLISFSYATKTISMFSVGMLFFINPILQAIFAVIFLGSEFTFWHKISLPLIGVGCGIYIFGLWRKSKNEN